MALVLVAQLALMGCSDDDGGGGNGGGGDTGGQTDTGGTDAGDTGMADAADTGGDAGPSGMVDCDPIQPSYCSLPWPSNLYLKADDSRQTGYTLTFGETTLPANGQGNHVDPAPYSQLDGYGPSTSMLVHLPDVDTSQMAAERNMAPSVAADSQTLLFEIDASGQVVDQVPHWVELDQHGTSAEDTLLAIKPGVILKEATRYVVAVRNATDTSGNAIAPSEAFQKLVDGETAGEPGLESRQARFDEIFAILEAEGVATQELTIAWDFVTGSSQAMHAKMLTMVDRAFDIVGEDGAELTVTEVTEYTEAENEHIALEIKGTFRVPRFMKDVSIRSTTGPVFNLDDEGLPVQNGWREPTFWIRIPRTAINGEPHGLVMYGHGLLGRGSQVRGGFNSKIAFDHSLIFYAADLTGFAEQDINSAGIALVDLSRFPFMADRQHQGLMEWTLLTRAMMKRFPTLTEVTDRGIQVDPDRNYYSGISQGGIMGATYLAISPDVTRGHLGVPGSNYGGILLQRSVDFAFYARIMEQNYENPGDRMINLLAMQLLWDRVDAVTYYRHLSAEPFDGVERHALFAPAKGDYQVAPLANEIVARTGIGIKLMENYGREVWGGDEQPYPYTGSGIVLYDFGNPWPPEGNLPPEDDLGDPHGKPRRQDYHNQQMVHFLDTGEIIDVCGGDGCTPD